MKKFSIIIPVVIFGLTGCSLSDIQSILNSNNNNQEVNQNIDAEENNQGVDDEEETNNSNNDADNENNNQNQDNIQTTFTVTFNSGGGSIFEGSETQTVSSSEELVPPVYVKDGHEFVGWDKDLASINSSCEVTAQWQFNDVGECFYFCVQENGVGICYVSGVYSQFHPRYKIYSDYHGLSVTEIRGAFMSSEITEITIPENITCIGKQSFQSCTKLTTVNLHDNLTQIGLYAFHTCSSLKSIVIPSKVSVVGYGSFWNCSALESVTLTNGIEELQPKCFANCTSLTEITLPASLTTIRPGDAQPFFGCTSLERFIVDENNPVFRSEGNCLINVDEKLLVSGCKKSVIPNDGSVTKIGECAFQLMTTIDYLEIPESIVDIERSAFWLASINKGLVVGKGQKNINESAFNSCFINSVFYKGTEEEWNSSINAGNNNKLLDATRYYYSEETPSSADRYWRYVNGEPTVWTEADL